ncbi:MAG: VanZ family protein [Bacteroidales bacterium]|nr:VanZ family protein [Bacteroidales bacterium]
MTMNTSSRKIMTALFCAYIGAIFFLCFMKGDNVPDVQLTLFGIPTDKIVHFCMFAPYPVLSFLAFCRESISKRRKIMVLTISVILGAGLAYGTEQLQGLTDYRSYDITDFYADLAGICCGTLATLIFILSKRQ